jgi:hypothetical protein
MKTQGMTVSELREAMHALLPSEVPHTKADEARCALYHELEHAEAYMMGWGKTKLPEPRDPREVIKDFNG